VAAGSMRGLNDRGSDLAYGRRRHGAA
jgi:hypothetical protein